MRGLRDAAAATVRLAPPGLRTGGVAMAAITLVLVAVSLAAWLISAPQQSEDPDPQMDSPHAPRYMGEPRALELAAAAIGEEFRVEAGLLELPPDAEVWVFGFRGDVALNLPDENPVQYNNLTLVLDALTGEVVRTEAFYGDLDLPTRAPEWLAPADLRAETPQALSPLGR